MRLLESVEGALRGDGRHYDAACVALDLATALAAGGRPDDAARAREQAETFLARLGCVNAY